MTISHVSFIIVNRLWRFFRLLARCSFDDTSIVWVKIVRWVDLSEAQHTQANIFQNNCSVFLFVSPPPCQVNISSHMAWWLISVKTYTEAALLIACVWSRELWELAHWLLLLLCPTEMFSRIQYVFLCWDYLYL